MEPPQLSGWSFSPSGVGHPGPPSRAGGPVGLLATSAISACFNARQRAGIAPAGNRSGGACRGRSASSEDPLHMGACAGRPRRGHRHRPGGGRERCAGSVHGPVGREGERSPEHRLRAHRRPRLEPAQVHAERAATAQRRARRSATTSSPTRSAAPRARRSSPVASRTTPACSRTRRRTAASACSTTAARRATRSRPRISDRRRRLPDRDDGQVPERLPSRPASYVPPGWSDWDVAGNGYSEFNYNLNENGNARRLREHGRADYLTDVLAGQGRRLHRPRRRGGEPFLLEIATFAPHCAVHARAAGRERLPGPEGAARRRRSTRRTSTRRRWLGRRPPLTPGRSPKIDAHFRKRAQAVRRWTT